MTAFGLAQLFKMGCVCAKESLTINNRRFYIRSRLGEGGFSYVDLIEDAKTRKLYALKRILCHSKDEERIAMQEVEVMRSFNHPNIIPLEEAEIIPVDQYSRMVDVTSEVQIVMPLYPENIQERVEMLAKQKATLPEEDVWRIFMGICHGLQAMHSYRPAWAHRDLKPANIMLATDETPILMDLGSAAKARMQIRNIGEARLLMDTAAERCSMLFRAPELFSVEAHSNIDERTDIWSLGCVLYVLAFLESPFEKAYQRGDSIALAVESGRIKFPENSKYSKSLEELVVQLMAVNPMERPFIDQVITKVENIRQQSENRV